MTRDTFTQTPATRAESPLTADELADIDQLVEMILDRGRGETVDEDWLARAVAYYRAEVERLQAQEAVAWDEGWDAGADDQKRWRATWASWDGPTPNPYR